MQLSERVAMVTGAGSGIGQAAALLLARQGAKVAALRRTEEELKETVARIGRDGGEAMVVTADVSKADEVVRAYRAVSDRWGRLDIVFANAGVNGVWAPSPSWPTTSGSGPWRSTSPAPSSRSSTPSLT